MGWQARSCRSLNIGQDRRARATLMMLVGTVLALAVALVGIKQLANKQ